MQEKTLLSKFGLEKRDPYLFAIGVVAIASVVRFLVQPFLHGFPPFILLITAVTISALYGGLAPGLLATVLAIGAAWIFFDRAPLITDSSSNSLEAGLLLFAVVATLMSILGELIQREKKRAGLLLVELRHRNGELQQSE